MITSHTPGLELADHILDLAARSAERSRQIDRFIDYFGGAAEHAAGAKLRRPSGSRVERAGSARPWSQVT